MTNKTVVKTQRLMIKDWDLKKKKEAIRVMDELRKKHKLKNKEKTSTQIIRHFREKRYSR